MGLFRIEQYVLSNVINRACFYAMVGVYLFSPAAYADICDDKMSQQKEEFTADIEEQFNQCGSDESCRKKVKELGKKRPYVDAYRKCIKELDEADIDSDSTTDTDIN